MGIFRKLFGSGLADNPAALVERGTTEYRRGEFGRAADTFTQALNLGPGNIQALIGRGQSYLDLGREQAARADFAAALEIDRASVRGHFFWRGQALGEAGRFDLEVEAYTYLLGLDPNCALAFAARGNTLREIGDLAGAMADCDAALRLGDDAGLYATRGLVHLSRGDFPRAVADFTEAIRRDPSDLSAYQNRATAYRNLGDQVAAAADEERGRLADGG